MNVLEVRAVYGHASARVIAPLGSISPARGRKYYRRRSMTSMQFTDWQEHLQFFLALTRQKVLDSVDALWVSWPNASKWGNSGDECTLIIAVTLSCQNFGFGVW